MELGRIGTALALLVLAGAVGAVAAGHPLEALIALPVAAVALQALRRLWGAPLRYAAMAGLILFHFAALWRFSWFDQDIVPLFRPLRAVIGLGMAGLLLPARPRQFIVSPAGAAFILALPYVLWVLVSGQFAPRPARVTFYSLWLLLLVLDTALVCSLFKDPRDLWRSWLIALLIVGGALTVLSLAANLSGLELAQSNRWVGEGQRFGYRGLFVNPNIMGNNASLTLAAMLGLRLMDPDKPVPRWSVALTIVIVIVTFSSLSRGAVASLLVTLGAYAFLRAQSMRIRVGRLAAAGLAAGLLLFAAARTDVGSAALERLLNTSSEVASGEEGRVHIWRSYLQYTMDHPIIGIGFNDSPLEYDYISLRMLSEGYISDHSMVALYMIGTGVPGTIFMGIILLFGWRGLRHYPDRRLVAAVVLPLASMSVPILAMATTGPSSWGALVLWVPLLFACTLAFTEPPLPPATPAPNPQDS